MNKIKFPKIEFKKYTDEELIIRFFPVITLIIGITMFIPSMINITFQNVLIEFMPLYLWGIMLIVGSIFGFNTHSKNVYMVCVSVPLLLYASILWRGFTLNSTATVTGVFTYTLLGIYSVLFSGRILK